MSIKSAIEEVAMYVDLFNAAFGSKLSNTYSHIGTSYKASSTKRGNNPKAIKARRKKKRNENHTLATENAVVRND